MNLIYSNPKYAQPISVNVEPSSPLSRLLADDRTVRVEIVDVDGVVHTWEVEHDDVVV